MQKLSFNRMHECKTKIDTESEDAIL